MLIRPRDILEIEPPFLILFGNGEWKVANQLVAHPDGVGYFEPFSLKKDSATSADPDGIVYGSPWHVGDNVWEMGYNTQIMTLDHPQYRQHPAWQYWLYWLARRDQHVTRQTH